MFHIPPMLQFMEVTTVIPHPLTVQTLAAAQFVLFALSEAVGCSCI
jgi:hypothetical protein